MIPRSGRIAPRQTAKTPPQPKYQAYSFPGPSLGWVSDKNLAVSQPGAAYVLENIFPTATGGILRRGNAKQADLTTAEVLTDLTGTVAITSGSPTVTGTGTAFTTELAAADTVKIDGNNYTVDTITDDDTLTLTENASTTASGETAQKVTTLGTVPVEAMFSYVHGSTVEMFAGMDGAIFDVSTQVTPSFAYAVTDGYFVTAQYTSTDGTRYVRGVNGTDTAWLYDGTSFSTTPALTFAAPDNANTSDMLDFVWVFANRFFFLQKNSMTAWYLPVAQIGGELARFDLGGVFNRGGSLIFGGAWSLETGAGLNQLCVFATDKGEVAVYSGTNPGDANNWSLVGVYVIGKPKGPKSFTYRGGDIIVATDVGMVALSSSLSKDPQQVALSALSAPIEDEWRELSALRVSGDWTVEVWPEGQMLCVGLPTGSGETPTWLVANVRTNKWAPFTGWDATCILAHDGRLFFGSPSGIVYEANTGGSDDGAPYTGVYVPVFDQLGVAGLKTVHMARAVMRSSPLTVEKLSVHADFNVNLPTAPDASPTQAQNQWGVGLWGTAIWGGENEHNIQQVWRNLFGDGEAIAIAHQVTSGGAAPLDTEFIRTDVTFTVGEMQT